jgi:hypothetical protein
MRRLTKPREQRPVKAPERPNRDIQVGRFRITLDWVGPLNAGRRMAKPDFERGKGRFESCILEWSGREG